MPVQRRRPKVVIVGGGFAGLAAARRLRRSDAEVVLLDRRNHHLFQPLLYQVATAALSPSQVAVPIRKLFARDRHIRVVMAEATAVDAENHTIRTDAGDIAYDYLVLAAGARYTYFGNDRWRPRAPGLKSIEDALEIRRRFLLCFERAERENEASRRAALMTFVVVGGGPTGVELAGALAEIATKSLPEDFRHADTTETRIVLAEAGPRLLAAFDADQSERAARDLTRMGVDVRLNTKAASIEDEPSGLYRVELDGEDDGAETIACGAVFWAAGIEAEPIAGSVGEDHAEDGRIQVRPDLSVPGLPTVFAVGDVARVVDADGNEVPGVAQGAMQTGRHAGRIIAKEIRAGTPREAGRPAFRYRNKGNLATIGRRRAVADLGWIKLAGLPAWLLWAGVHILFLIGFRNKLVTMIEWMYAYVTFGRGARLITQPGERCEPERDSQDTAAGG